MYKLTKHNAPVATLSNIQACLRYIGLNLTIKQALNAGYAIKKVRF